MARPHVTISNPDKLYFPSGFKKVDMIRYYGAVSSAMLPHLQDRPVTLIRFPQGVRGEKFYEKNAPGHAPDWIKTAKVARRHHDGFINYILVKNVETLAWCANLGAIEFHPFLHRADKPQTPSYIAFDLDPGEGADLLTCIEVADILRGLFNKLDLECYPKVSGSKGLQLYVPLNRPVTYEQTTPFAKTVAELLAKQFPSLVVSEMSKSLRRGRVLIDWSQNSEAKTTVCVYSLRGKHDEPFVSAPVTWEELARAAQNKDAKALFFSPEETLSRVKKRGDLFAPLLTKKQKLPVTTASGLPDAKPKSRGSLARNAEKRDFARTAEPGPALPRRSTQGSARRFVIQKHAASHLHYDFRLEMGDTLKSWAIPKGLPYELGVKRSAFQVEDHPIEYLSFEGTIPKGQYGGGTVMVWDIGTYEVIGGNWHTGDLKLWLSGKKLKGEWHIFRIKSEEGKPVWLIVKAGKPMKPLSPKQEDRSVLTQRSLAEIGVDNDAQWDSSKPSKEARTLRPRKASVAEPEFVSPMKPQLVTSLPEGPEWLYEVKWDGFRALILKHGKKVRLLSRNEKSLASDFKDVVAAAETLTTDTCVLDGEIVALDDAGKPSFQALQNRSSAPANIVFYAFDLLSKDGEDWKPRSLRERQDELARVIQGSDLRLSRVLSGTAAEVLAAVGHLGLEGVVAKRSDASYVGGDRSSAWQKVRLRHAQEFVVGGYRPGMKPFESVLVGYYEDGKFLFAGKVRPGFTPHSRAEVWALIKEDETPACPFANLPDTDKKGRWGEGITPAEMKTLYWVKPRHVIEIEFLEWTDAGHLRHASFRGIRTDKAPRLVVRESPE